MKIEFEQTQIEVGAPRNGKPGYKWGPALYVIADGVKIYPPMRIREAKEYAKQLRDGEKQCA